MPSRDGELGVELYDKVDAAKTSVDDVKDKLVDAKRQFGCTQAARDLKYLAATAEPRVGRARRAGRALGP